MSAFTKSNTVVVKTTIKSFDVYFNVDPRKPHYARNIGPVIALLVESWLCKVGIRQKSTHYALS